MAHQGLGRPQLQAQACQHGGVGIVDGCRRQGGARRDEFVARGEDAHPQGREDGRLGDALGRQHGDVRRAEHGSSPQDDLSSGHVLAPEPDELPGGNRPGEGDLPVGLLAVFLHDDGVCARGNEAAGEQADGLAGAQGLRRLAGETALLDGERDARPDVGGPHGVAVHRTVVGRRQVQGGRHVRGQDSAVQAMQGQGFRE
ncbi:hypothetical protein CDEF62S_02895 [Castellaniella defragrans]